MKRQLIIDYIPQRQGNEIVYVPGVVSSLGAINTAATVNNVNAAASVINTATSALPTKPVTYQTDFSVVANKIASVAGTVAAVAVFIAPPAGTIIAAVAGIVAAACVLLGKLFANSKAKALAAERAQYEAATSQLQYENLQLDDQYVQTYNAIEKMRSLIAGLNGLDGGLGLCIFNCKKKEEEARLDNAKDQYELENKLFNEKTQALMKLVDEFNNLMREYNSLLNAKQGKDIALYVLLGAAVLGTGIAVFSATKK